MESAGRTELRFARGQAGAEELQRVVDEVIAELGEADSESAQLARATQLDVDELAATRVTIQEDRQGVEPVSTTIVVSIVSGVATHIVGQFWDYVVWPRLKRRLGAMAVGPKKP
jgi:hypothetical protein